MSWRTQGQYRGLGDAEQDWLRDFDREWDTKSRGRSRTDAFDHLVNADTDRKTSPLPKDASERTQLEADLLKTAADVARLTVPRATKSGWSIHLVMKCGKRVRAHFEDRASALQAYTAISELSLWFSGA